MVNIYVPVENRPILALSIPTSDLERLSKRPVKWLRFVTFAVCGAHGDLSTTPQGSPVNYDSISLNEIAEVYYYTPEGDYNFIDHNLIKDSYIQTVFKDRRHLYDSNLVPVPSDLGIDSIENGLFLRADLHLGFAHGECAFLKTSNFALNPADIPRLKAGRIPFNRITLHHLEPDTGDDHPIPQYDAHISRTATSPPSPLILDFMYGVAAYQRWGSGEDIKDVMQQHYTEHYKPIPVPPAPSPHSSYSPERSEGILQAMDYVLALSMFFRGVTPETMVRERQRQEEVAEKRAKEASRVKVQEWMQSSSSTGS
ncbi:hypothetical protein AGABI1DRAFT_42982 [Agaricus bisporus var. burnettii JB137-S8]|uniref:HNH nuclease domain-containing protein n=1 Tax=Agaricus bisporus var. burnettii (strain JB137-S8 / ATCC MYA-4627 / FGSC 10392) TaxID=597362 RepID=K5WR14_AGABU|nr:uncharacterized protein AGABI1DRAFT_42982 [Agaricus bisporus var. burnettii JB137-S8]EKM77811.1 hypothetical protein AGABI1DRAFT_42982 [Agaricus bisporus var. burnettii JB137-S8]